MGYLRGREDVTVWGVKEGSRKLRVPVISFTVKGRGNKEIVEKIEGRSNFGCRWGHFYSKRLVEEVLGLGDEGVVRVSLVHYNTGELIYSSVLCKCENSSADIVCRGGSERVCEGVG